MSKSKDNAQIAWNFMKAAKKAARETGLVNQKNSKQLQSVKCNEEIR
jgi:pantoate kinase